MKSIESVEFVDILVIENCSKMTVSQAFNVLFLPTTATSEDLKKHYKKLATLTHPDKNEEQKESAERKFQTIAAAKAKVEAYLKNPTGELYTDSAYHGQVPTEEDGRPVDINFEVQIEYFLERFGIDKFFNHLKKWMNAVLEKRKARSEARKAASEATEAPYQETQTPDNATQTPKNETGTSKNATETPHKETEAPHKETEAPHEETETPDNARGIPQDSTNHDRGNSRFDFQRFKKIFISKSMLNAYLRLAQCVFNLTFGSIHQEIADTVRSYKSAQDRQRDLTLWQPGVLAVLICFTMAVVVGAFLGLTIVTAVFLLIKAVSQYMSVKITHGLQQLKRYRQHVDREDKVAKETTSASSAYYQSARAALKGVFFVLFSLGLGLLLSPLLAMVLLKSVLQIVTYPLVLLVRIPLRDAITKMKGEPYIGENWNIHNLVKNIRKKIVQIKIAQNLKVINQQKIEIMKSIVLIRYRYKLAKERKQQTTILENTCETAGNELLAATFLVNLNTSTNTIENFEACESAANDFLNLFERDRRTGTILVETTQKNDLLRLTLEGPVLSAAL